MFASVPHGLLRDDVKARFQNIFIDQATSSYLLLCMGMGLVAFLLPVVLVAAGGYQGHFSISYFYHVSDLTRNLLVGALWAIGVFLFLFHGLSKLENWLLNAAGCFGISVAMNPMAPQQCGAAGGSHLHEASALLFFLCLAIVAIFLAKDRIACIDNPAIRWRFAAAYNLTGAAMIAMPATVYATHLASDRGCATHWLFWVETCGIWSFAAFWFVKTLEYRLLLGARWVAPGAVR